MKAYYSITVGVFDQDGLNTSASFTFYLDDRNNFPRWISTMNRTSLREDMSEDVFQFAATSLRVDSSLTYSILSGNDGSFDIDPLSGKLSISRGLDRESQPYYRLWLAVTDSDSPPKLSITSVDIVVEDVNDNSPIFEKVIYSIEIMENSDPQQHLCTTATDRDQGDNADIRYSIIGGELVKVLDEDDNAPKFSHLFHAEIPEDLEMSSYRLRVRVSDGTWAVQTGAAISVLDVNDNAPLFEKERYVFVVNESQVNKTIGKVMARDADEGENGVVHYRLQRDVPYISIDIVSGEIRLLALPEKGIITVIVNAQDNGVPAMLSSVSIVVVLASASHDTCEIAINKDTPVGTVLGRIENYCNYGTGRKAIRRFFADESLLMISPEGEVITTGVVRKDAEVELISEQENGQAILHHVRLELSQGNAASPHFEEKIFRFAVSEGAQHGDVVGVVYAKDTDMGLAGKIRYHLETSDIPIHILPNGTLLVWDRLDYESQRRYIFNVTATDQGQPPRNATTQVVVDLLDVNDNPPVIEDIELVYAVTSIDETICPSVTDIDTSQNDLQFAVSMDTDMITTDHCITIPNDFTPVIDWTVSDKTQSITVKVRLVDMVPEDPNIQDENVTLSEGALSGTIVSSYETEIFAEKNEQLSTDAKDVKVIGERGIRDEMMTIYAKSKFGRSLRSSKLQLASSNIAPSPVFPNITYAVSISDTTPPNTTIHDFSMPLPTDCILAVVDGDLKKVFCFTNGSELAVCGRLRRLNYALVAEVLCGNKTRSRSEIEITVVPTAPVDNPIVGFLMENVSAIPIAQLPTAHSQKFTYRIGDRRLREVFVDADNENAVIPRHLNATAVLGSTPAEFDLSAIAVGSQTKCAPKENDLFEVSAQCHIAVKESVDYIAVEALVNGSTTNVRLNTLQVSRELEQSSLQVVFYAAPAGVADFLTDLQRSYTDLTFHPLAIDVIAAEHRNALSLAVVDRNRRVIAAEDSRDILRSFFQKDDFPHALLQSLKTSLCDDHVCANGGSCHQQIALQNASTSFYGSESIWNIPNGMSRTSGVCFAGVCECLAGFTGADCALRAFDGISERKQKKRPDELKKPSKKGSRTCTEMKCGDG
ncbi:cadherin domain protein, partial [Teladorsagia circumcincta]